MAISYCNPVWPDYFADPFVLRVGREYFAYGTGETLERDGRGNLRAFPVLRSTNLVDWSSTGGALEVPEKWADRAFWAPEVAGTEGRFHLYYSSAPPGRDELHRLHVAQADNPTGPFVEIGPVLPEDAGFCIDAHPFRDPSDGRWYLFYAMDYFAGRTGTGLAVVPLAPDLARPSGPSRLVVQANADWQIYERRRLLYDRRWEAWHTVEGPCVVAHDRRYYCFYSGGNWQAGDYGVSYAVADHPQGPWQHAKESGPIVLSQRVPEVLGPGHNSYIVAPDGEIELLVYHAWDASRRRRRLCLDRLVWTPAGPRCLGPTTTPQVIGAPAVT